MAHLLTRQGWEKTLQNVSTENSKDKKQKKKTEKIDYPKTVGQVQKVLTFYVMRVLAGEREQKKYLK